jgi:hypothetical protein
MQLSAYIGEAVKLTASKQSAWSIFQDGSIIEFALNSKR